MATMPRSRGPCRSYGYDKDGVRHNCHGAAEHPRHYSGRDLEWDKDGAAVEPTPRCPVGRCKAPLPRTRVCPRNPAHTPDAWAVLKPQEQGIHPGLPRSTVDRIAGSIARERSDP